MPPNTPRRSPSAVPSTPQAARVLAFGAYLKNRLCTWDGRQAHWSPVHGDLGEAQACEALRASAEQAPHVHGPVQAVAHDWHSDFYSTACALEWAHRMQVPAIAVQHHHAHIAAVAASHALQGPVLGWALDGFGLGPDEQAWGGELLWVDGARWQRLAHLAPLRLPGGDRAAREPWRLALAVLHDGADALLHTQVSAHAEQLRRQAREAGIPDTQQQAVQHLLTKNLNCPSTSSAGRWFDAVAALLGVCLRQNDEAQAPQALQALAEQALTDDPRLLQRDWHDWLIDHPDDAKGRGDTDDPAPAPPRQLPMAALLRQVLACAERESVARAAAVFHLGLADGLVNVLLQLRQAAAQQQQQQQQQPLPARVCLSGGCLFNRVLRERLLAQLHAHDLPAFTMPPDGHGDAHLALGQAWVARALLQDHSLAANEIWRCEPLEFSPCASPFQPA